mmetsp:Transcript_49409/g.94429  ORF Transcript_49409/g.94429 Transcript_49409/m.94429 type:complete len:230 (+) Transcript_49409:794-1483(+)
MRPACAHRVQLGRDLLRAHPGTVSGLAHVAASAHLDRARSAQRVHRTAAPGALLVALQAANQSREFALHGHVVERGQRRRRVGPEGSREPAHLRGRPEPVRLLQEARLGAGEFARRYRGGSSWRGGGVGGVGARVVVVVGVVVGRRVLLLLLMRVLTVLREVLMLLLVLRLGFGRGGHPAVRSLIRMVAPEAAHPARVRVGAALLIRELGRFVVVHGTVLLLVLVRLLM